MRSIFAKILVWSFGTLALSLVAYGTISRMLEHRGPPKDDPFHRMIAMIEDDACRAYEEGGRDGLAAHLWRLDTQIPGEHILTDPQGRDLATGADRSALVKLGHPPEGPPLAADGRLAIIDSPRYGRYRFITLVRPWFHPPNILPYYGAVVLVIVAMGAILTAHLAVPLRRLRRMVEQFGRGDLAVRARSTRRDEIGELSRAFDDMAARIATLLEAERRLLRDVSHELRSPLARLGFAIELARTGADREAALDRVRKEADRIATLVGELLQLTRLEGDPSAAQREEVSLNDVLGEILEACDLEAQARGCQLELHGEEPLTVEGERELLHRAVENVVRNAIRHTAEGTAIQVDLKREGELARIEVRDYGPGVPEEDLPQIFEPFFRVEADRSRASGGVGLGLAIARRAVGLHRGSIRARNANPGLVVAIELPGGWAVLDADPLNPPPTPNLHAVRP
jgi:two-component system sensor histidine kinase CpxA